MAETSSRRDALKRIGAAAGIAAGTAVLARARWAKGLAGAEQPGGSRQVRDFRIAPPAAELPELVVARGGPDPAALTAKALAALGGMARFVSRGDLVVVKPNIGWDRGPLQAANTNPDVVAAVVKAAYDAGARHVVVTDVSCNEPNRCFQRSGIWKKAYELGAEVVLPAEHRFRTMRLRGDVLDEWPVFTPLVNADKLVNVPVAKHHNLAKYTGAMKNWYGSLGGRRNRLHQNIDMSIADLATFLRPTLTVIDATRVLVRNGPQGGNIDDTVEMNTVVASVDQVAADAFACGLVGQKREAIGYLRIAQQRGIGTMHFEKLRVKEA
jgi:uncharacterized protein (DUF362 family)